MKRNAFLKHLKSNGCILVREGANHSLFINPDNGKNLQLADIRNFQTLCAK